MSYYQRDVHQLYNELFRLQTKHNFLVENFRDYRFAIDIIASNAAGLIEEPLIVVTACQPQRDDIGQKEIFRTAQEVIDELDKRRFARSQRTSDEIARLGKTGHA